TVSEIVTVTVYVDDVVTSIVNHSLLEGLADGTHNITIKAVDIAGNVAYSEVLFTIITSSSSTTSTSSSSSTSTSSSRSTSTETTEKTTTSTTNLNIIPFLLGLFTILLVSLQRKKLKII
ncbi:MAG: hypothetical protein ACXAC7_22715, partial [Candidatus Hodarchaeales archaeon]